MGRELPTVNSPASSPPAALFPFAHYSSPFGTKGISGGVNRPGSARSLCWKGTQGVRSERTGVGGGFCIAGIFPLMLLALLSVMPPIPFAVAFSRFPREASSGLGLLIPALIVIAPTLGHNPVNYLPPPPNLHSSH